MPELWDWFARGFVSGLFIGLVVMAGGCLLAVRSRDRRRSRLDQERLAP